MFHSLEKFDGEKVTRLTSAHAKQIAGRAGRYGMDHNHGAVTTLEKPHHSLNSSIHFSLFSFRRKDLPMLHELIAAPVKSAKVSSGRCLMASLKLRDNIKSEHDVCHHPLHVV